MAIEGKVIVGTEADDVFSEWWGIVLGQLDIAIGNAGNDTYYLSGDELNSDHARLVEQAGEGTADKVVIVRELDEDGNPYYTDWAWESSGTNYTLPDNIENLQLLSVFGYDWEVTGNAGNNLIDLSQAKTEYAVLDGGAGADTLIGGWGSEDEYYLDSALDVIREIAPTATWDVATQGGGAWDHVYASFSYTLPNFVEGLQLGGSGDITGTGNDLDNDIYGNAGKNQLTGKKGNDRLEGHEGNDTLNGDEGNDTLNGGQGADLMNGGAGNDRFYDDYQGRDFRIISAIPSLSADTMVGGAGDDLYHVDNLKDVVTEAAGGGNDTINMALTSYVLAANVENLVFDPRALDLGGSAVNFRGNLISNRIVGYINNDTLDGDAGNDVLDGMGGNDTLIGGLGNDTFMVYGNEYIVENALTGSGIDTVIAMAGDYTLGANLENLVLANNIPVTGGAGNELNNTLTGNLNSNWLDGAAGSDTIRGHEGNDSIDGGSGNDALFGGIDTDLLLGGEGNDTLDGGIGSDFMRGGLGDDVYFCQDDNPYDADKDRVRELAGEGTDTVYWQTAYYDTRLEYVLDQNVENVTVLGDGSVDLWGNGGNNVLTGGGGYDYLNGGRGADTLKGGKGDDTYYRDGSDSIAEDSVGGGIDTVLTRVSYTLENNIENAELYGKGESLIGNILDNRLTGNASENTLGGGAGNDLLQGRAGADSLVGGAGADTLEGGSNNDTMKGEAGNDVYFVDSASDIVVEAILFAGADGGKDKVFTRVNVDMNDTLSGADWRGVEDIEVLDADNHAITGNTRDNLIVGGAGDDTINGGDGNDTIIGGSGSDTINGGCDFLVGGAGNDTLFVDTVWDTNNPNGVGVRWDAVYGGIKASGSDSLLGDSGIDTVNTSSDFVAQYQDLGFTDESQTTAALGGGSIENFVMLDGALFLEANNLANKITGNADSNRINGRAGADTMIGGKGNDIYVVDTWGATKDTVTELAGEGFDIVYIDGLLTTSAATPYKMDANVEAIGERGSPGTEASSVGLVSQNLSITGNDLDNLIFGTFSAQGYDESLGVEFRGLNVLDGGAGNDILVGRSGADRLIGGVGSDFLVGDDLSRLADSLHVGNSDSLLLPAVAFADTLHGGAGDDFYLVDSYLDRVWETTAISVATDGTGTDSIVLSAYYKDADTVEGASFLMAADSVAGGNDEVIRGGIVENLYVFDFKWETPQAFGDPRTPVTLFNLTGNAANNRIFGGTDHYSYDGSPEPQLITTDVAFNIDAGAGNDIITLSDYWVDRNDSWDVLFAAANSVAEGEDIPHIDGTITGGTLIRSALTGADTVIGGAGNDVLHAALDGNIQDAPSGWINGVEEIHFYLRNGIKGSQAVEASYIDMATDITGVTSGGKIFIHDSLDPLGYGETGDIVLENIDRSGNPYAFEISNFSSDVHFSSTDGSVAFNVMNWDGALLNLVPPDIDQDIIHFNLKGGDSTIDLTGVSSYSLSLSGHGNLGLYVPSDLPLDLIVNNAQIDLTFNLNAVVSAVSLEVTSDSILDMSGVNAPEITVAGSGDLRLSTLSNVDGSSATGSLRVNYAGPGGSITGGSGDDVLIGSDGSDTLAGGGADNFNILEGGAGYDTFVLEADGFSIIADLYSYPIAIYEGDKIDISSLGLGAQIDDSWFAASEVLDDTTLAVIVYEEVSGLLYYNDNGDWNALAEINLTNGPVVADMFILSSN